MKEAIILCSGGLDSVVTSHYIRKKTEYEKLIFLFFDYGQRNIEGELTCARKCCENLNGNFVKINLDFLKEISASMLNSENKADEIKKEDLKDTKKESLKWYVPCRNIIFINYALALAESIFIREKKETHIFLGFKNEGKESYPDATIEFVKKINELAKISCNGKFKIKAPLIKMDKEDIIILGKKLGVNFKETFSCYVNKEKHCGKCLACRLRMQGFYWANIKDPTEYENIKN